MFEKKTHTQRFLEKIAFQAGLRTSAYAIHKHMHEKYGWSRATTFNYVNGSSTPGDAHAIHIAVELQEHPSYVMACIAADRSKLAEAKEWWEEAAERIRKSSAAALGAVIMSGVILAGGGIESARASAGYMADRDLDSRSPVIHYAQFLLALWRRLRAAVAAVAAASDELGSLEAA